MGHTGIRVLRIGPKNYPPDHGGVEQNAFLLVKLMPWIENHVFTEWPPEDGHPLVHELPKGLFRQARLLHRYAKDHQVDIIHLHKETFIPLGLLLKSLGHRCVVTVHGCAWRLARWPFPTRVLLLLLDVAACCLMDRVVFVGEHDYRAFQGMMRSRRLHLIRNGIEARTAEMGPRNDSLVYLGRLSPEKNTLALIEAADAARIRLDLYGPLDRHDSRFRRAVDARLRKSHYVRWRGRVPQEQVPRVLAGYPAFINPSFSEGLPTSVLEAAAQGLFLIMSDIPAHRVLSFPGCAYVNPRALGLENVVPDSRVARDLGAENREHALRRFNVAATVRAYDALYQELL